MQEPGLSADRVALLTVSAVGNVGLSHDPVTFTGTSLHLLSLCMAAGRVAPILFAWHLLRRGYHEAVVV
jgi:Trk-type K+ transport system membrane component